MDKVRIGMIGTGGGIAQLHANQLKDVPEAEIAAIADPNDENRGAFSHRYDISSERCYKDYHEMMDKENLDAVIICTPHSTHYPISIDALDKGLHVLVEKPMTCSTKESDLLNQHVKKTGKLLLPSYQRHLQPEFIYIHDMIAKGELGKLVSVSASLYQYWWRDGNEISWRTTPEISGGGFMMDSGVHIIDMLLWTTGLTPEKIQMQYNMYKAPVEIDTVTSIKFAEGAIGSLTLMGNSPQWHETYVFCGEEGGLFYDNNKITYCSKGGKPVPVEIPPSSMTTDKNFVGAILGRNELAIDGEYAAKVVKLAEDIYASAGYHPYPGGK